MSNPELRLARLEAELDDMRAKVAALEVLLVALADGNRVVDEQTFARAEALLAGPLPSRSQEACARLLAFREAVQGKPNKLL